MEKGYHNYHHDEEISISPKANELLEKIIDSDVNDLGIVLGEILASRMNVSSGQAEISHQEAESLIRLIDLLRPRYY